jgi:hypothetical protein
MITENMKIKELFKPVSVGQSFDGRSPFLDQNNCKIVNKHKNEDSIIIDLKRESDGEEGHAYLRVLDEFKNTESQVLDWAFENNDIIGLTINQLENFETNLNIENIKKLK